MEVTNRDWKSLPVEPLQMIFQELTRQPLTSDLCNLSLVCKAWLDPVQRALYSKIIIRAISQLQKFHNTVHRNPQLGEKVKTLDVQIGRDELVGTARVEISALLTILLSDSLRNLEQLNEREHYTYSPILDAMSNSRLTRFKRLQVPRYGIATTEAINYVDSTFLMQDRLENLFITDKVFLFKGEPSSKQRLESAFQYLYDNLHQFNRLTEITIERETDEEIQAFEHVVESCVSLKNINLMFTCPDNEAEPPSANRNISAGPILSYTPRPNIESLKCEVSKGLPIISYLMHKFPKLQGLSIDITDTTSGQFDLHTISQLLNYLSQINDFQVVNLAVNQQDNIMQTIGEFWEVKSRSGFENVCFSFFEPENDGTKAILGLERNVMHGETNLNFDQSNLGWQFYMNFIKKSGRFIGEIEFRFGNSSLHLLPQDFMTRTFFFCENLRSLSIVSGTLDRYFYTETDLVARRPSIQLLYLSNCIIHHEALGQLSRLLSEIEILDLGNNVCRAGENHPVRDIFMPNTIINNISISGLDLTASFYLKIFNPIGGNEYYYRYDAPYGRVVVSNGQEYNLVNDYTHFYVCCQLNINNFQFEYMQNGTTVTINLTQ